jgi:hypothetical protein
MIKTLIIPIPAISHAVSVDEEVDIWQMGLEVRYVE